jgi:hypothetical protein
MPFKYKGKITDVTIDLPVEKASLKVPDNVGK